MIKVRAVCDREFINIDVRRNEHTHTTSSPRIRCKSLHKAMNECSLKYKPNFRDVYICFYSLSLSLSLSLPLLSSRATFQSFRVYTFSPILLSLPQFERAISVFFFFFDCWNARQLVFYGHIRYVYTTILGLPHESLHLFSFANFLNNIEFENKGSGKENWVRKRLQEAERASGKKGHIFRQQITNRWISGNNVNTNKCIFIWCTTNRFYGNDRAHFQFNWRTNLVNVLSIFA